MKKKSKDSLDQTELWIPSQSIAQSPGHPFYVALNKIFSENKFDEHVESLCERFYKEGGRPSIAPGVYFRMLFIGYFESIDSERGIAWRCADSLALRSFLGYELHEKTPSHSTLSVIRNRLDLETHEAVFSFCLQILAENGLLKGKNIGIDATNLEANAAMRHIIRRDTGDSYTKYLFKLAAESGETIRTKEELARFDRKRKKTMSNKDWESPSDPDSRISKMKKGNIDLTHKVEHSCDLDTGAVVAVNVAHADKGDTTTIKRSVMKSANNLEKLCHHGDAKGFKVQILESVVADKGYHSRSIIEKLARAGVRTYISEPKRGRLKWKGKMRTQEYCYANRNRIRNKTGVKLRKLRAEKVERSFAHCYTSGNMRRVHLRGSQNIEKRLLIHVAAFNMSVLMREKLGAGKPKTYLANRSSIEKERNGLNLGSIFRFRAKCSGIFEYMQYSSDGFCVLNNLGAINEPNRWIGKSCHF